MLVTIAGASGFIGREVIKYLLEHTTYEINGLSRSDKESDHARLRWSKCDLFSVLDIEECIKGSDVLIYLVHSMQPSARLDQGSFDDYDLIMADNWGRAARVCEISKVIYLGGITPAKERLSRHLLSRLEVERALGEYIPEHIYFRAGLIIGDKGSSFQLLLNLIKRLPIIPCPVWTQNLTSPVHIDQVVENIAHAIESDERGVFNLTSTNSVTYLELLEFCANELELKRSFWKIKCSLLRISGFWVSLFSGAPKTLVYPLIESLKHSMIPKQSNSFPGYTARLTVQDALRKGIKDCNKKGMYKFSKAPTHDSHVRSVQRFYTFGRFSAQEAALEYIKFLPRFLFPLIKVSVVDKKVYFSFLFKKVALLKMVLSETRSTTDRQIFYIKGGILAARQTRGRLEFREAMSGKCILVAIHDFYPSLPWFIYKNTQAVFHLFVMRGFGRYLRQKFPKNK